MATITKRGTRWSVQVRRKGVPSVSRTFATKSDARAWACEQEALIESGGQPTRRRELAAITVGSLIGRYLIEVTPTKRSAATEKQRMEKMRRDPVSAITLDAVCAADFAAYRDRRLADVKPGTVHRELSLLHHLFDIARKEWRLPLASNPLADVRRPRISNARDRRLTPQERDRLFDAISESRGGDLRDIVELALETGLRRGEVIGLTWADIDLERSLAHIPVTKTGRPRTIPLSFRAWSILSDRPARFGAVFNTTPNAVKLAWVRAVKRAKLTNLRFHDLRHEAVSRLFELGLSLPEVAVISGHRDARMLMRYTHLRPEDVGAKIRRLTAQNAEADTFYSHIGKKDQV